MTCSVNLHHLPARHFLVVTRGQSATWEPAQGKQIGALCLVSRGPWIPWWTVLVTIAKRMVGSVRISMP